MKESKKKTNKLQAQAPGNLFFQAHLKSINSKVLYLLLFTAFMGPAFLAFEIGSVHLFPYRLVWVLLLLLSVPYLYVQRSSIVAALRKSEAYFIYLTLWLIYAAVSLLWVANMGDALRQLLFLVMGISIIFLVAIYFDSVKSLYLLQIIWVLTLAFIVVIGIWNMLTGLQLPSSSHFGTEITIPTSVFYYHNDFATFLVLSLPFLLSFIRYDQRFYCRALSLILIILVLLLLLVTGSRANVLALTVGVLFWFVFLLEARARIRALFVGIGLVILISAFTFWSSSDLAMIIRGSAYSGVEKIIGTFALLSDPEGDLGVSFTSRLNFIRNGIVYLIETYGFGVGAGNADYYIKNFQHYYTYGYYNLHNWWLEIAVNYGLLIFGGFLFYYFSLLHNLFKVHKNAVALLNRMMSEALLLSLVIFFFASMSSSSLFGYGFPWILFAFATGFVNLQRNYKDEL